MKNSTKGRYALRLMLDLALNSNGDCISIKKFLNVLVYQISI
jgi:DNA-binding IscR family transcriptional regulator